MWKICCLIIVFTGVNTAFATLALGDAINPAMRGPITEVFNELGLVLALMGSLGGATFGLAIRSPLRELARGMFLGGMLSFGFGVLSPKIVEKLFDVSPEKGATAVPALAATAFTIGFLQDIIIKWALQNRKKHRSATDE